MKNTNNMDKGNFEKVWKDAFSEARLEPSESLWAGIEAAIANDDVSRYRRGLVYYRWLVAAGLLFFATLLGYLGYMNQSQTSDALADGAKIEQPKVITADTIFTKEENQNFSEEGTAQNQEQRVVSSATPAETEEKVRTVPSEQKTGGEVKPAEPKASGGAALEEDNLLQLRESREAGSPLLAVISNAGTPAIVEPEADSQLPETIRGVIIMPEKNRRTVDESLWAGLNMTPGYFNPNYQSQGIAQSVQSPNFNQSTVQPKEDHRTGFSMSFGVDMGMRISDRWQVSGGLHYLNNNVQSTTNTILDQRTPVFSSVAESLDFTNNRGTLTFNETELDNTFQFLSIPVQAGFTILDHRVKLLINAGIASDIFLKNRITATDNSLDPVTIKPGSEAPFRTVYFNGLVGAQASYEILPRYMITLEPRYKLAISDFARSDASYTSLPSSFGVGVGIKYVFK